MAVLFEWNSSHMYVFWSCIIRDFREIPTAMAGSLFDIPGASSDTSVAEIKAAYRKAARAHHPDLNPGNTTGAERFKGHFRRLCNYR